MIKKGAALLSTEEAAFALRQALGSISAWHKTLECMRNDRYLFMGIQLLPATRINDGYGWRPYYDAAHVRQFILEVRSKRGAAVAGKSLSSKRGDYDTNVSWRVQTTKTMSRLSRGVKTVGFCVGVSVALATAYAAEEKPRVTYVGEGRYACSGNSAACAQIDANNRQREQQRQFEYERRRYEMERYIRESRQHEQENGNR